MGRAPILEARQGFTLGEKLVISLRLEKKKKRRAEGQQTVRPHRLVAPMPSGLSSIDRISRLLRDSVPRHISVFIERRRDSLSATARKTRAWRNRLGLWAPPVNML